MPASTGNAHGRRATPTPRRTHGIQIFRATDFKSLPTLARRSNVLGLSRIRRRSPARPGVDVSVADPEADAPPGFARLCNLRSEYRCSMCPAIHTTLSHFAASFIDIASRVIHRLESYSLHQQHRSNPRLVSFTAPDPAFNRRCDRRLFAGVSPLPGRRRLGPCADKKGAPARSFESASASRFPWDDRDGSPGPPAALSTHSRSTLRFVGLATARAESTSSAEADAYQLDEDCNSPLPGRRHHIDNDPSAGSPTETLLRLLLPLNDQV